MKEWVVNYIKSISVSFKMLHPHLLLLLLYIVHQAQIAHLGWATNGPPAPVAATAGPPVAHPPHRWRAIWGVGVRSILQCQLISGEIGYWYNSNDAKHGPVYHLVL